jgi:hypothetical protein
MISLPTASTSRFVATGSVDTRAINVVESRCQTHIQVARYVLDAPALPLVTETLPVAARTRIALMRRRAWCREV